MTTGKWRLVLCFVVAVLIPRIDRAFDQMHERFADRLIQTVEAAAPS